MMTAIEAGSGRARIILHIRLAVSWHPRLVGGCQNVAVAGPFCGERRPLWRGGGTAAMAHVAQRAQWVHFTSGESGSQSLSRPVGQAHAAFNELRAENIKSQMRNVREELEQRDSGSSSGEDPPSALYVHRKQALVLVNSRIFNATIATAILINCILTTIEVDHPANKQFSHAMVQFFTAFFTLEILMKLFAHGCKDFFIATKQAEQEAIGWNWFDFSVVLSYYVLQLKNGFSKQLVWTRYIRVLRFLRVLRTIRVFRLYGFDMFRKPDALVTAMLRSIRVVSWIAVLLCCTLFLSAVTCTMLIGNEAAKWKDKADTVREHFGSMRHSSMTLFQLLTLADWAQVARLVAEQNLPLAGFFVAYVIFAAMVILSLLTGVLADHMNAQREEEEAEEQLKLLEQRDDARAAEYRVFAEVARSRKYHITMEEFMEIINSVHYRRRLEACGCNLDAVAAEDLFVCLDRKARGVLSLPEFRLGMEELRTGINPQLVFKVQAALSRAIRECQSKENPKTKSVSHQHQRVLDACASAANRVMLADAKLAVMSERMEAFLLKAESSRASRSKRPGNPEDESLD